MISFVRRREFVTSSPHSAPRLGTPHTVTLAQTGAGTLPPGHLCLYNTPLGGFTTYTAEHALTSEYLEAPRVEGNFQVNICLKRNSFYTTIVLSNFDNICNFGSICVKFTLL